MKRQFLILAILAALVFGVTAPTLADQATAAAPASHPALVHTQAHPAAFDKTRFVLHLGIAAFLIHYIYKKYKDGKLGRFHIINDVKAGIAALFAYHELKVAYNIANSSKSKTLQLVVKPINALLGAISSAASKLKHGDTSGVSSMDGDLGNLSKTASAEGFAFKDTAPPKSEAPGF
jgi:hypothetical protein